MGLATKEWWPRLREIGGLVAVNKDGPGCERGYSFRLVPQDYSWRGGRVWLKAHDSKSCEG